MPRHHYTFVTRWTVESTPEEVFGVIDDTSQYVRWWPAVWLEVEELEPGDQQAIGRLLRLTTKGWLPYILSWKSRTVEKVFPERIVVEALGDFAGRGCWTFAARGALVDVVYEWDVAAEKPLLRYLSAILKPIFAANHGWAMARGLESLRLELARRHAASVEERLRVPAPPGPTFLSASRRRRLGLAG